MKRWKVRQSEDGREIQFLFEGKMEQLANVGQTVWSCEAGALEKTKRYRQAATQCVAALIRDHHRAEAFAAMRGAIKELLLLVDDMMPNIARGVVQNYQRLNEAPRNAKAALALCDKEPAP